MSKPIEFKTGTLSAMSAIIRELDNVRLADTMHTMLGGLGEFFAGEATVIDLTQLSKAPERAVHRVGLLRLLLLRRYGLQLIAVRALRASGRQCSQSGSGCVVIRFRSSERRTPRCCPDRSATS